MHSCFLSRLQPGNRQVGHGQQRLAGSMVRGRETVSAQRATRGLALPAAAVLKASRSRHAMKPGSRGGRDRGGRRERTLGSG